MKLERQPSNLIDSFAQTETHTDTVMTIVPDNAKSNDMVDSGVGSQHKSSGNKELTTGMDEDEDISLSCEKEKEMEEASGQDIEKCSADRDEDDDDKKDDEAS